MFIPFENLTESSRVWIYTSERPLFANEHAHISERLKQFASNWQSHQKEVVSSYKIIEDRFVVIACDETSDVSGCGIDKSVHLMQELEKETSISFMDKTIVYFITDSTIQKANLKELRLLIENNLIRPDTLFYNTLVTNIEQLHSQFKITASQGWIKRYFTLATLQ